MSVKFSRIFAFMFFVMFLFAAGWPGESAATAVSATSIGRLSPIDVARDSAESAGNATLQAQRGTYTKDWAFDFSQDPNFEQLLGADSLKSAVLTLNLHPDELEITAPELTGKGRISGNRETTEPHNLSIQTTAKIEVDLLDIYSAEDLLKLFSVQAGKLPISYHDPDKISSVELQLITERPERWPGGILLIISVVVLVSGLLSYVAWKKISPKQESGSEEGHHTRLAAVGEQTSTVIHDVKNSFAAIRGCAEIIADDSLDPQERKEFVELIVSEIDRGVYMTQELLEFSRGRKPALRLQPVFVPELLQQTLSVLQQDLQARHIQIQTDIQQTSALQLDPEKMRRVFMNLISNAKEAMPDGGSLTIRSYRHKNHVCVEFVDNGCGMPPEIVERIFEPFMTRGKASGTGLGMAIVKDIIDAHQAEIDVESVENQGTCFRICLPDPL